jgi:hypothetical protein
MMVLSAKMRGVIAAGGIVVASALPACGPRIDVAHSVTIESVSTGWNAVGMVAGRNKVVPLASVTLKNVSDRALPSLQVNAVFHRKGDASEWGTAFVTAAGPAGLTPGAAARVTMRSQLGYTGTDSTDALLANSHFVDAVVDVFAKAGSTQWTRVAQFPIERQLLQP